MLNDYLLLFNLQGEEYKKLIYDPTRKTEDKPINPNAINQGALHKLPDGIITGKLEDSKELQEIIVTLEK